MVLCNYFYRADKPSYEEKLTRFQLQAKKTDIAACKCYDFNFCIYPGLKKVPVKECCFLLNERLEKSLHLALIVMKIKKNLQQKNARKQQAKHSASADYIIVL